MSDNNPIELAITHDFDTGEIWIDTNHRSTKTKLRKLGLKPKSTFEDRESYVTDNTKIRVSIRAKSSRNISERTRNLLKINLEKAREAKR